MILWAKECAAVIPCLNEAKAIGQLVREVRKQLPSVIVVDDGSSDLTAQIATEAGAEVLRHNIAKGKGAALQTGWAHAHNHGFTWAMTMDGDGQHSPQDIAAFQSAAEKNGAVLVAGNRMAKPVGMPWLRRQVNRWMSRRLSRLAGCALPDTQCGFRLMNLPAWSALQLQTSHFEIESELLLAFAAAGHKIEFVPVQVIYQDETSKIRPLTDTWRWFAWLRQRGR